MSQGPDGATLPSDSPFATSVIPGPSGLRARPRNDSLEGTVSSSGLPSCVGSYETYMGCPEDGRIYLSPRTGLDYRDIEHADSELELRPRIFE